MYLCEAIKDTPEKMGNFFLICQFDEPVEGIEANQQVTVLAGGKGLNADLIGKGLNLIPKIIDRLYQIQLYENADQLARDHLGELI